MPVNRAKPSFRRATASLRRCIASRAMVSMKRGFTPCGQAGMQWPLPEHTDAQRADASGGVSPRRIASTPAAMPGASAASSPAGPGIGHTSTQRPHAVQLSSTPCVRVCKAGSKPPSINPSAS